MRGTRTLSPVPCVSGSCQKARHGGLAFLESTKLSASPGLGRSHIWLLGILGVDSRKGAQALAPAWPAGLPGVWGKPASR